MWIYLICNFRCDYPQQFQQLVSGPVFGSDYLDLNFAKFMYACLIRAGEPSPVPVQPKNAPIENGFIRSHVDVNTSVGSSTPPLRPRCRSSSKLTAQCPSTLRQGGDATRKSRKNPNPKNRNPSQTLSYRRRTGAAPPQSAVAGPCELDGGEGNSPE